MKNIIKAITSYFSRLFERDIVLKITSGVAAVIIWFTISVFQYPTIDKVFYNVPVKVDLEGSYAQANSIEPVSMEKEYVTVYVTGKRTQIGDMKSEDLVAYADGSEVKDPRNYKLSLKVKSKENKNFEVTSIEPSSVDVSFDEIIEKEFPVEANIDKVNVNSKNGYMKGTPLVTPDKIKITGPKEKINSIGRVVVPVVSESELEISTELSASGVQIYNNNNALIDNENGALTLERDSFTVQVPVYVKKTIPLEVSIINEPDKFDKAEFMNNLQMSATEIVVAAPNDKINVISRLNIGTIDMRKVDIGSVFEFKTDDFLPEGYEDLNQISEVTVNCPSQGLAKKAISIRGSSVQFVNVPSQFDYEMITSGFTVYFVGPEDVISELTSLDIVPQIDMIDIDMTEGDKKLPVTFSTPAYPDLWCIGSEGALTPTAVVTVSIKDDTQ